MITVELPAKPGVVPPAERVEAWLARRGTPSLHGVSVLADGSVRFALPAGSEALREAALAAWAAFDPAAPTADESAEAQRRAQVRATLAALDAGVLAPAQHQKVTAWLARQVLRLLGDGG